MLKTQNVSCLITFSLELHESNKCYYIFNSKWQNLSKKLSSLHHYITVSHLTFRKIIVKY